MDILHTKGFFQELDEPYLARAHMCSVIGSLLLILFVIKKKKKPWLRDISETLKTY